MLSVGDAFNLTLFYKSKNEIVYSFELKELSNYREAKSKKNYESDIFKNATILRYPVYDIWTLFAKLIKI